MTPDSKHPLPNGWRWVRLGEVCEINPRRPAGFKRPDGKPREVLMETKKRMFAA